MGGRERGEDMAETAWVSGTDIDMQHVPGNMLRLTSRRKSIAVRGNSARKKSAPLTRRKKRGGGERLGFPAGPPGPAGNPSRDQIQEKMRKGSSFRMQVSRGKGVQQRERKRRLK